MPALPQHQVLSGSSDEFEPEECAQKSPWLGGNLLAVAKVTRLVIRDRLRRTAGRFRNADFGEPLVNVFHFCRPRRARAFINWIALEQLRSVSDVTRSRPRS